MNSRIVYSTGIGNLCPNCRRPVRECVCPKGAPGAAKPAIFIGDEIGDRLCWNRRMDFHDERDAGDARDRRDIVDEIEADFFVERCVRRGQFDRLSTSQTTRRTEGSRRGDRSLVK